MISGVYKIVSLSIQSRCYIGSSKDIYKRWEQHLDMLSNGNHHSAKLQRHFNKYGKADLQFALIVGCERDALIPTEQYFIDAYKPYFNGRLKAFNNGGYDQSDAEKRRKREAMLGDKNHNFNRKFSEQHRKRMSDAMKGRPGYFKGRHLSEEAKRKISESMKGKSVSPTTQFKKGRIVSPEERERTSMTFKGKPPWNKGVPMREESRQKLIASIAGKPHPNKGHKHSDEVKKRLSEIKTKYYENKRLETLKTSIINN